MRKPLFALGISLFIVFACNTPELPELSEAEMREATHALSSLKVTDDLDISLFASEPWLINPTNIDIDHKGRVWACEGYNYRNPLNPDNPYKQEGDRIVIIEDENGDGIADKQKIFYQGEDINAALGIAVLGNKVYVSRSPYIFVFTDENGDDIPDQRDTLFSGIEGVHHDHSIHAITFGPDGRLYFNFGNEGNQLLDKDGKPVIDIHGYPVIDNGEPYREGMIFRCNPDGSEVEVLAHNFRNNYEVALDSYGAMWQSDNDDDGNRGVRINFILPYGNYGYKDEKTGAGWRSYRTGMAEDIPSRHWHQRDPGSVPNLLQTGAGSPTGIMLYEGSLLPERYQNQIIHCDAGPRVVRAYPVSEEGAGYKATQDTLIYSTQDLWFRPTDVCAAPDGSLLVSDWYDPGVGGHLIGDFEKGRVFRLAPGKGKYRIPTYDFNSAEGAVEALKNPSQSVRYLAWTALEAMGGTGEDALIQLWKDENPRFRARALWLLARIAGKTQTYIEMGLEDKNADIRKCAFRVAQQLLPDKVIDYVSQLKDDPDYGVLREAAIALRFSEDSRVPELWAQLAERYQGGDRWYLEALGIGADLQADQCFEAWLDLVEGDWDEGSNKDIVWRMRASEAVPMLSRLIEKEQDTEYMDRYFRAFDFHPYDRAASQLTRLLQASRHPKTDYIRQTALAHIQDNTIQTNPEVRDAMEGILATMDNEEDYLNLTQRHWSSFSTAFKAQQVDRLKKLIYEAPERDQQIRSLNLLISEGDGLAWMKTQLTGEDPLKKKHSQQLMSYTGNANAINLLEEIVNDVKYSIGDRQAAVQAMAQGWRGSYHLLSMLQENKLDKEMAEIAANRLVSKGDSRLRNGAMAFLPESDISKAEIAPIAELIKLEGDAKKGEGVFVQTCSICHQVNGTGVNFGPDLSEIGNKLSKEGLFAAVIYPNAGINFGYEGFVITTQSGDIFAGYIESQEEDFITLRQNGGISQRIAKQDISNMEAMDQSLMPEGLHQAIGQDKLIDLISYLAGLKEKKNLALN